jgi:tetratricopeptide (TPR) repeat protein
VAQREAAAPARERAQSVGCAALLLALAVAAYENALDAPFLFDDAVAIEENYSIRAWPPWPSLSPPRETPVAGRPLVNLSLALDYARGGLEPRVFRGTNLALHALCGWLFFLLSRASLRARGAPGATGVALAAAALWLVHPLNSECVDYPTQRTELLAALCYLLALLCVARAASADSGAARRAAVAGAWAAAALGMASKESVATLPLVALLYDAAVHAGSLREALRRRGGLYAGLCASWIALFWLHASAPRGESVGAGLGVEPVTWLWNQQRMLATYLVRALWPRPLVLDYGWPLPLGFRDVWREALLVALWAGGAAALWWRRPAAGFPLLAGLIALAPSSSVVPIVTEVGAERRMYLPLAGLVLMACVLARALLVRLLPSPRAAAAGGVALAGALVLLLAAATRVRNLDYLDAERLWRSVLAARPGQPRALLNLGAALRAAGRPDEAEALFRAALRAHPPYARAEVQLALLAQARGDDAEAEARLARALELEPRDGGVATRLGELWARSGRSREALALWRQAYARDPQLAFAANNIAWLLATHPDASLRDGAQALELALRAVELTAGADAGVLDTLAAAYAESGRFEEAVASARRAQAAAAGDPELAAAIAERLAGYAAGRPWRDDPARPPAPRAAAPGTARRSRPAPGLYSRADWSRRRGR